jgi:phage terminase large subunit
MTLRVEDASLSEDVRSVLARRGVVERGGQQVAHVWRPRGSARTVLVRRDDEVLMSGPAGTGKSRACLEKLNLVALKYPGMHGAILRKTAASLGSSALKTWREDVIPELLANGTVYFYGGSQEEPPQYRYNNGSTIVIGGLDKPSKIMSTEYDMIYVQEATELTVADCNPDTPTHWLKTRCDEGKTYMINCRHEDNPRLFTLNPDGSFTVTPYGKSYMRKLDNLTGVRHLRLRMGQWVAAEGMIFDDFRAEIHVIDEMPKGWETWSRYWSIDFGFTNPFVLQCWAEDPDGRLYLYREIYRTRRTVDQDLIDARKPASTLEEFPGYVWMSGPDGKPVKEDPNKINDHGCDAMRYECVDRDPLSRPRIRSFRV